MSRLIAKEGGRFPFYFDQREGSIDVPPVIIQGLLVAPGRERRVKVPAGTPEKLRLKQFRQSRISVALVTDDPKLSYRPAESNHPDVGVRFDRENAAGSLAGRSLDSRPTLPTAQRQKTTIPLSGQPPLEPTHRLIDLKVPFGTVAVTLAAGPSEFKLATLTNGTGGLTFPSSQNRYRELLAKRTEAEQSTAGIGTNSLTAETKPSAAKI